MDASPREVRTYETLDGECPFEEWLADLDGIVVARIRARLNRVACGNLGDAKSLGDGVSELRFPFGSGYRVYFGIWKDKVILLLSGGDKRTQAKDILKAKIYWQDFRRRNNA